MTLALASTLPQELNELKQYITVKNKTPQLINQNGTTQGKWLNPNAWATLEGATVLANSVEDSFDFAIVLSDKAKYPKEGLILGIVDLDKCFGDEDALQIINEFNSFTEVSISGTGYHIFFQVEGTYDQFCNRRQFNSPGKRSDVRFNNSYVVVTGRQVEGTPKALNTLSKEQVEQILGCDVSANFTPDERDAESFKLCHYDPIKDDYDTRWRQILEYSAFDLEIHHLIHNRVKVSNKLKEDNSGSGIAWRLLIRVWDMFTDPADLMAVYQYAYIRSSGGTPPTESSVRASVYKVINTRGAKIQYGERISNLVENAEDELYCAQNTTETIDSLDVAGWRQKFSQLIGTGAEITAFYQDPITSHFYLCITKDNNRIIVDTKENITYSSTFRSKVASLLGLFHTTPAKVQKLMPIFAKCMSTEEATHRLCDHFITYVMNQESQIMALLAQITAHNFEHILTRAYVGRHNTQLLLDIKSRTKCLSPNNQDTKCVYYDTDGNRMVSNHFINEFIRTHRLGGQFGCTFLVEALGLKTAYNNQQFTLFYV